MAAVQVTAAIIFLLVLATYVLQAALIALTVAIVLLAIVGMVLVKIVPPLIVFTIWLLVLPFAPKRAMAWMKEVNRLSRNMEQQAATRPLRETDLKAVQQRAAERLHQRGAELVSYTPLPHWDGLFPAQLPGDEEFRQRMMAQVWALRRERLGPSAPRSGSDAARRRAIEYLAEARSRALANTAASNRLEPGRSWTC